MSDDTVSWQDNDSHYQKWLENKQDKETGRLRQEWPEYFATNLRDIPVADWRDTDPHLNARSTPVLGVASREVIEGLRLDFETDGRKAWLADRERYRREARLHEAAGLEVPADVLAKANEPDLYHDLEEYRQKKASGRKYSRILAG